MKKPFVRLCPEITREHVQSITGWLRDEAVRQYLSDREQAVAELERLSGRVGLATLTHLFSQDGRFLMICDRSDRPVGYVRMICGADEIELVIVIGDRGCWGRHFARQAVRACLRIAFYEMRAERVVARIHTGNERSRRLFSHIGFRAEPADGLVRMTMTMDDYLRLAREQPARGSEIVITGFDRERLLRWLDRPGRAGARISDTMPSAPDDRPARAHHVMAAPDALAHTQRALSEEIDRAVIVDARELPRDVVSMNSRATLSINEKKLTVSLAFPDDAGTAPNRVSILSPVGTAILGFSAGDQFNWRFPAGLANIRVDDLHYQPEAAGHYHL